MNTPGLPTLAHDGLQLAYRGSVPGDSAWPVALLHGFPDSSRTWGGSWHCERLPGGHWIPLEQGEALNALLAEPATTH